MAKVAITEQYLEDIADAIREKTGLSTATYLPSEMAPAILTISGGGGITPTGTLNITSNGTYNVTQYASAAVAVPTGPAINNQDKSITPIESAQTVTYDSGYTGLGTVSVGAISSSYVGTGIARKDSSDLVVNENSITAPAGYYSTDASSTVSSMTLPTSAAANATSGFTSKATISRSTSDQYINIPIGYNSTGVYYKVSAVPNGTAGTPTATKGTVSNHSISVTPSVTNTTGYITGSTINGTAVTVSASELVSGNKSITANGTGIDVTNYATVSVSVSGGTVNNQDKSVSPTESEQEVTYDSGYTGLGTVTVGAISSTYVGSQVPQYDNTNITINGATVSGPSGGYWDEGFEASVSSMTLPTSAAASATSGYISKATISRSTSDQYINIPTGYNSAGAYYKISAIPDAVISLSNIISSNATITTNSNTITLTKNLSQVSVNVTTPGYFSSGPIGASSISLTASMTINPTPTASGKTVTIPAGYYTAQTTKDVSTGSATAPASISGSSATVSTGTNTITLSKTISVTPTVSAGYISSGTAGNSAVSLTASVTTKAATTYHPSTTAQSISSGTYLTGAQTIAAVTTSNLSASNIVSGVTIKVGDSSDDDCVASVTGNVVLQNYYTGSSAPSSSLGSNGDLYLQS